VQHDNNAIGCLASFEERDLIFHEYVTLAKPVRVAQVTQGNKAYGISDTRPSAYPAVGMLGTDFPWKSGAILQTFTGTELNDKRPAKGFKLISGSSQPGRSQVDKFSGVPLLCSGAEF
jgi:hypothetical protein